MHFSIATTASLTSFACVLLGAARAQDEQFESKVRPVLATHCVECHGSEDDRGHLRLHTRDELLAGGDSGPAIVPGDPDASLLIQVVRHQVEGVEMPSGGAPLSAPDIAGLARWIQDGAIWPEGAPAIAFDPDLVDPALSPSAQVFVERVRPVLEQTCFACHKHEERGGLRLDTRARMLQGGGRGPAIVPGAPEQSLLIAALQHTHEELRMPHRRPKLSDETIAAFAEWIRSGAEWAEATEPLAIARRATTSAERAFWSFQPLSEPEVPEATSAGWGVSEIDRFIARMHDRQGVVPVERADKRALIRRATYDLTGLPPTPAEVAAFVGDDSPEAFETVVDRLLASAHYGERWGRHWLDVTRFGEDDTRGLAEDRSGRERYPMAYVHRDWVVGAFNADMPYDDFVRAQLAGDLVPEDERAGLLPGLGFLGQGPWYYDLADPLVARADERHDRVDVTSRAFLGLSVGCARCHDHKYDPIGIHDYYSMAGVFNNTLYHEYPLVSAGEAARYEAEKKFIKQLEKGLEEFLETESMQLTRVLTSQASSYMMAAWQVAGREQLPVEVAAAKARLDLETLVRWVDFLDDEPRHYPYLEDWQALLADDEATAEETEARAKVLADAFQRLLLEVSAERAELKERNRKIIAKGRPLEEVKSVPMPNGFESFFDEHQLELETMERARFSLHTDVYGEDLDNEIDTFFPNPPLLWFDRWGLERQLSRAALGHVVALRAEIKKRKKELSKIPVVMGVRDRDEEDLGEIALHVRGNPMQLGEPVSRGFPDVLTVEGAGHYTEGSGRLQLANDIVAHPITARVIVNRVWAWHMGSGLVATPSNFGFAGLQPSHPELLESLAARFVAGGMRIKPLHREIMLSQAYQLASDAAGETCEANGSVDPGNRYLWKFQRRRMDAEEIRDTILAVSGELDRQVGGASLDLGKKDNDRRTIYGTVSRFLPDQFLRTFDFPSPSLSAERRFSTNTPVQSLYFMNSPFVKRQADALVRRLAREPSEEPAVKAPATSTDEDSDAVDAGKSEAEQKLPEPPKVFDDRAMMARAYALLYSREPSPAELQVGLAFLEEQRRAYRAKPQEGQARSAARGEQPATPDADLAERKASMSAWVHYAGALFNTVEFRFID